MLTFSGQRGLTSTATFGWRIVTKKLHFGVAALICIGLVLLTLTGGSWYLLERSRQTALRAAETTLQHAALIVESVINRQLLQIDGALVSLPALFTTLAKGGGAVDAAAASSTTAASSISTTATAVATTRGLPDPFPTTAA